MTRIYKAAWNECLRISRAMCFIKIGDPRREALEKKLAEAIAIRKSIGRHERGNKK